MVGRAPPGDHPAAAGFQRIPLEGDCERQGCAYHPSMASTVASAKSVAAEAGIARECARGYPALELFQRVAERVRRVVPYGRGMLKADRSRDAAVHGLWDRGSRAGTARRGALALRQQ
jgi:hypothetical protein